MSSTEWAILLSIAGLSALVAARGTAAEKYVRRFVTTFFLLAMLLSIVQCASQPWCPPPRVVVDGICRQ
jgi:hypothetical protein